MTPFISVFLAALMSSFPAAVAAQSAKLENQGQSYYEEAIQGLRKEGTQDLKKVFDLLSEAAKHKHPEAIGTLGYLYANGIYVTKDDVTARQFFQEAVDLKSKDSRINLGLFLIHGRGGAKDLNKGLVLIQSMVSEGNNQASLALGEIFYMGCHNENNQPDYAKAYEVLLAPASAGIPEAQNFIGIILKDGRLGFKDDDSARLWFEKAAWQGNSKACANLAEFWDYQSENRKCRIEALRWMIVADSLGEIVSKYHLLDITPFLAKDEEKAARNLAELTISQIKSKPKKPN